MKKYIITLIMGLSVVVCNATTYLDFEEFPATTISANGVPSDSTNWEYSSSVTNDYGYTESDTAGWKSKAKLSDGWNWFWASAWNGDCGLHMGVQTHGYLSITESGHAGKSLSHTITGGRPAQEANSNCQSPLGTPLYNLESYSGTGDIYTGGKIGHSYIFFNKINTMGVSADTSPYSGAASANRFSIYIRLPSDTSNGVGGYNNAVDQTYQAGLFLSTEYTGSHHYYNSYTQGGGWTKFQIEETSNGDNSGNGATRYIPNMLHTLWRFYLTTQPYSGISTPPYSILIDDISFDQDNYTPQNNETISNISILYKDGGGWEVSFNDKYKNANAYSTYELRYSLSSPITNENWGSATPAQITSDSRFYISARNDGKFQKWWPYYQGVWAPFTLTTTDTASLTAESTVYFAIKDISQNSGNLHNPVDGINGYWSTGQGGRDYTSYPAVFDYTADSTAVPYVKRISYTLSGQQSGGGGGLGNSYVSRKAGNAAVTRRPTNTAVTIK
jgi:hypothetical protein